MPGVPERQTHDYARNGTTTLFAALEVATGRVEQTLAQTPPYPAVKTWLERNPRIALLRLDQGRRHHHYESQPSINFRHATLMVPRRVSVDRVTCRLRAR
jgi:hypothetical protein